MSLDTQIELLGAALYGWLGFTIGVGVCTGNWSLSLFCAAGFCTGKAMRIRERQQRQWEQ